MVAQGWALAYRHYSLDYVGQERRAESAKAGMWQGQFQPPWEWRRGMR
jgi:endonuclease YncB( thermonuclease family)